MTMPKAMGRSVAAFFEGAGYGFTNIIGLIVAASGAVANDLMLKFGRMQLSDNAMVFAGRATAIGVGIIAMALGVAFKSMNVSFLVGWAFAIAASANLPCIIMMLFWKGTTSKGMVASIIVGIVVSVGIILFSPTAWELYGLNPADAPIPLKNPGIFSIPLSFIAIYVVSKLTKPDMKDEGAAELTHAPAAGQASGIH